MIAQDDQATKKAMTGHESRTGQTDGDETEKGKENLGDRSQIRCVFWSDNNESKRLKSGN